MQEEAKFYELDLNHKFNNYDKTDAVKLKRGLAALNEVKTHIGEQNCEDVYWFCIRHWFEKEAQEKLYQAYFANKLKEGE